MDELRKIESNILNLDQLSLIKQFLGVIYFILSTNSEILHIARSTDVIAS